MDNEKRDENFLSTNIIKSEKLSENINSLKERTREFIISSPFLIKAQESTKDFMKKNLFQPIENVWNTKVPELKKVLFNNKIVNIPLTVIENSNHKNLIELKFNDRSYNISYTDRKVSVVVLSFTGTIVHFLRSNTSNFKFKWLIPYYVFFSLLFCRENLDPYGS